MAKKGGVAKRTYCNYESGERDPMGNFFAAIAAAGADVQYILTGVPSINLPAKPDTIAQHQYTVKAATEAVDKLKLPKETKVAVRDILYSMEIGNAEMVGEIVGHYRAEQLTAREQALLTHYRRIPDENGKRHVEQAAQIAARAGVKDP